MTHPSYYAILPAPVRYCNELSSFQKILFAEISALTNKDGYCFASNDYFAKLFETSTETISRAISGIAKAGFVIVEVDKSAGNTRKIYLSEQLPLLTKKSTPIDKKVNTPIDEKINTPIDEKVKYNNTSINNTSINSVSPNRRRAKPTEKLKEKKPHLIKDLCTAFDDFIGGDGISWTGKEVKAVDELKKKLVERIRKTGALDTEERIKENFALFLQMTRDLNDNWLNDHFTPATLNSQFNNLIIRLKNGKGTRKNSGISADTVKQTLEILFAGNGI